MAFLLLLLGFMVLGYLGVNGLIWSVYLIAGIAMFFDPNIIFWLIYLPLNALLVFPQIREQFLSRKIVDFIAKNNLLPTISETERVALRAGTTWVDAEYFSGKPNYAKMMEDPYPDLTQEEQAFLDNQTETACAMSDDFKIFNDRDLTQETWEYLKKEKFFGMIIPKEYGGLGFSALGHSAVIQKMASRSQVLAITTMVPNSLGPAELLLHYGTQEQKDFYLERLADGREIPCFALTEPTAGSDAGSLGAEGVLFKDDKGDIKIKINFEKRYITLGSIATVIGLACVISDPEHLLGDDEDLGITCVLVPANSEGINQGERHDPLGVPFYNSPLWAEDVVVGLDAIIGGTDGIGQGWQMLMQSLSVGRGISLPSTSCGGAKLTARVVGNYAKIRKQFGLSIGKFEGIEDAMGRVGANAYMLEAARKFTIGAIDDGKKPAVINAIMKYHATEKYRESINDGMDILGGAGISRGERNLLANAYVGAPIAITVEGANIMTRTLIVFGQGVIRCHPYAYKEIEALVGGDVKQFDENFFAHIRFSMQNAVRACALHFSRGHFHRPTLRGNLGRVEQKLVWTSAKFSFWTDVVMGLYGGTLKRKEKINARFGDILSWQYLITATLRRYKAEGEIAEHKVYVDYISAYGLSQISEAFDGIYRNLFGGIVGKMFYFTYGLCSRFNAIAGAPSDYLSHKIAAHMMSEGESRDAISNGIYMGANKTDGLGRLENAFAVIHQTEALNIKIKAAIASGSIEKAKGEQLLDNAVAGDIISEAEKTELVEAETILRDAIMVDSFKLDEYKSHYKNR